MNISGKKKPKIKDRAHIERLLIEYKKAKLADAIKL